MGAKIIYGALTRFPVTIVFALLARDAAGLKPFLMLCGYGLALDAMRALRFRLHRPALTPGDFVSMRRSKQLMLIAGIPFIYALVVMVGLLMLPSITFEWFALWAPAEPLAANFWPAIDLESARLLEMGPPGNAQFVRHGRMACAVQVVALLTWFALLSKETNLVVTSQILVDEESGLKPRSRTIAPLVLVILWVFSFGIANAATRLPALHYSPDRSPISVAMYLGVPASMFVMAAALTFALGAGVSTARRLVHSDR